MQNSFSKWLMTEVINFEFVEAFSVQSYNENSLDKLTKIKQHNEIFSKEINLQITNWQKYYK